jgi:intracellular sulfur oxidation DsrE/DsrF family protein
MKRILLTAAVLLSIAVVAAVSQTGRGAKHHVVFQLTEPEGDPAWGVLEPHVTNLQAAFAKDGGVEIEVVFYGKGLNMLRKTNKAYEERLKQLTEKGVKLSACQNAMKVMKITTEDLFPFASQVDSGIAELSRQQEAGWAYVH